MEQIHQGNESPVTPQGQDIKEYIEKKHLAFEPVQSKIETIISQFEKENKCEVIPRIIEGELKYTFAFYLAEINKESHSHCAI